ncbi:MAG: PepSY domain-containing protein, partial [Pseudomonadota bacterium]
SAHATPEAKMLSTTIQKIEKMNNATAFKIEADEYQGRRVYEIETLRGGEFYESYIDPETAQILTDEQESTPLWTPLDDEEKQTLAAVKIPLWQAIETIAAEQNASIQSASFMTEGGKSYFEFTLADGARYTVDANAGNVAKC